MFYICMLGVHKKKVLDFQFEPFLNVQLNVMKILSKVLEIAWFQTNSNVEDIDRWPLPFRRHVKIKTYCNWTTPIRKRHVITLFNFFSYRHNMVKKILWVWISKTVNMNKKLVCALHCTAQQHSFNRKILNLDKIVTVEAEKEKRFFIFWKIVSNE